MKYNEKNFKVMVVLAKLMKENPQIKLDDLSEEDFRKMIEQMNITNEEVVDASDKLYVIEKKRDELYEKMNSFKLRLKSLIIAIYGPDSEKLKQIGLTPKSERKKSKKGMNTRKTAEKSKSETVNA